MTASDVDRRIEGIARRQHGTFNARQAQRVGATNRMIRRRVLSGRWIELDHHVYALPGNPGTWLRQCMAATLAIDGAAISHTSSAALHEMDGIRQGSVHIVVPLDTNHRSRLANVHESRWARATVVGGIRVVTVADTLFQLAGVLKPQRFRRVFENEVTADPTLLSALFDRHVDLARSRLPGIAVMRDALDEHDHGAVPPTTELEHLLDALLDQVDGLPPRTRQAPLIGWDRGAARVDVMVANWRLIIEADGRRWHTRVEDFERDRLRGNVATAHGYDVMRFTYRQLTSGAAESLALLTRYSDSRRRTAA